MMTVAELINPFELARVDLKTLKELAEALGKVSNGMFEKLEEVLWDRDGRQYAVDKRAKAWLEYYRLDGFQGDDLALAKVNWIEPYLNLLVSILAPGYKDLRNLSLNLHMTESSERWPRLVSESMFKDAFSEFMIHCDLGGISLKRGHMQELFENEGMTNISIGLVKNAPWLRKEFPPREMFLFVCACCPDDEKSVRIAEAIESVAPGQAKAVDVNGWTPLVYSLFKCKSFKNGRHRFVQSPLLEKWLIDHGCDPTYKDKYGLSWRDLRKYLPGGCR